MPNNYRVHNKTVKPPRRPYEKERIDKEMKICGEYGTCGGGGDATDGGSSSGQRQR
jgi:hypothetical protein